jgi:hypothetical protein
MDEREIKALAEATNQPYRTRSERDSMRLSTKPSATSTAEFAKTGAMIAQLASIPAPKISEKKKQALKVQGLSEYAERELQRKKILSALNARDQAFKEDPFKYTLELKDSGNQYGGITQAGIYLPRK